MKNTTQKILSMVLVMAMATGSVACAVQGGAQVQSANDVRTAANIESDRTYIVEFINGNKRKVKGMDLIIQTNAVGVRGEGEAEPLWYSREQIRSVSRYEGSHVIRGLAIGAGVGAVASGAAGAAFGATMGCTAEALDASGSSSGACGREALKGGLIGMGVGAAVGLGIGAAIGAAIPKKSKQIIIAPTVSSHDGATSAGVGISGRF